MKLLLPSVQRNISRILLVRRCNCIRLISNSHFRKALDSFLHLAQSPTSLSIRSLQLMFARLQGHILIIFPLSSFHIQIYFPWRERETLLLLRSSSVACVTSSLPNVYPAVFTLLQRLANQHCSARSVASSLASQALTCTRRPGL